MTLQILVGKVRRKDFAAAVKWAAEPVNHAALIAEWSRLNEHD